MLNAKSNLGRLYKTPRHALQSVIRGTQQQALRRLLTQQPYNIWLRINNCGATALVAGITYLSTKHFEN